MSHPIGQQGVGSVNCVTRTLKGIQRGESRIFLNLSLKTLFAWKVLVSQAPSVILLILHIILFIYMCTLNVFHVELQVQQTWPTSCVAKKPLSGESQALVRDVSASFSN